MLRSFAELDRMTPMLNEFRRRMDELWDQYEDDATVDGTYAGWPRTTVEDKGGALVIRAEIPGLGEKDVTVTLNQDVVTLSGERKTAVPPGYQVHRQERGTARFSRSYALNTRVDAEKATAMVKQGVLTLTLPKAAEAQPRQIRVRAE
ncbi:MAG: Hsp20/alpha crystallin family protein [Deltaproteobacteria bacterium]|nr:Hsp20/alpha crystallin family protein [Deltaproteobacteria bacterium]